MRRLADFDVDDVSACSDVLRRLGGDSPTMEGAASQIAHYLYDEFAGDDGERALALARVYKTHPYGKLPADLQDFAGGILGEAPRADMRCLTLLGTAGDLPEWNDRRSSKGHQSIPLASEAVVAQLPMVSQLMTSPPRGLPVIRPDRAKVRELSQRTYDVFHVPVALGSPHVPAQN